MTQTKQPKPKFKVGDLVKHQDEYCQSVLGLGIIIATVQALFGQSYWVYWTKRGLDWHFEDYLEMVI